jgi:hypothetical protein|tara:strand:- start:579 stop:1151 length:573 start_codon:yes stop_codon:yes gene_type:complete
MTQFLENFGFYKEKIPQDLYNDLLKESLNCSEVVSSGITNSGVATHFRLTDTAQQLNTYIATLVKRYENDFPGLGHIGILTKSLPYRIEKQWINHQKAGEFIPNHVHQGIYSYSIWIKIPEIDDNNYQGNFEFTYTNIIGNISNKRFSLTKENEGEILFFPSKLPHNVYPFLNSDDTRISISGNIILDAG